MSDSLKARMVGTEAWNNKRYVVLGSPILAVIGVLLGWLIGVHLVSSEIGKVLIVSLFVGTTVLLGCTILAVIDKR
ncbi:hypothetical protein [Halostagnicola bangensis]